MGHLLGWRATIALPQAVDDGALARGLGGLGGLAAATVLYLPVASSKILSRLAVTSRKTRASGLQKTLSNPPAKGERSVPSVAMTFDRL